MKKSGRFESTLTAADDDYALIGRSGTDLALRTYVLRVREDVVKRSGPGSEAEMPPAMTTREARNRFHPQA